MEGKRAVTREKELEYSDKGFNANETNIQKLRIQRIKGRIQIQYVKKDGK